MLYAIYNENEYKCSIGRDKQLIKLLSDSYQDGFTKSNFGGYVKEVSREECTKVFKKELCCKYNNEKFLVRQENDDNILIESGPRSYNLEESGFSRISNDVFQKWIKKTDCELYWNETNY